MDDSVKGAHFLPKAFGQLGKVIRIRLVQVHGNEQRFGVVFRDQRIIQLRQQTFLARAQKERCPMGSQRGGNGVSQVRLGAGYQQIPSPQQSRPWGEIRRQGLGRNHGRCCKLDWADKTKYYHSR